MGEAKRKTYTAAFKAKVALEAIRGVKTVNEIGQAYGVHPVQVGQWKREVLEQAETLFAKKRGPKTDAGAADTDRLYSEIGRLKMELDWLKKKSGLSL
jgi:transposase